MPGPGYVSPPTAPPPNMGLRKRGCEGGGGSLRVSEAEHLSGRPRGLQEPWRGELRCHTLGSTLGLLSRWAFSILSSGGQKL